MPVTLVPSGTKEEEAALGVPEQPGHRVPDPKSHEVRGILLIAMGPRCPYTSLTILLVTLSS